jgi:disulfide bond formation protein DsbB
MIKEKLYLYLAWVMTCLTMLGSLYLSEVKHLQPCSLCWYERMCIFPSVILLGIAIYNSFIGIFPYAIPFPILGFFISSFHVLLQEIPSLNPIKVCSLTQASCKAKQYVGLGFISPPMIACLTFLITALLLILARPKSIAK